MHEPSDVVFFAGGGTGGHLYPALALADALGSLRPGLRAVFVGAERGIEARILPERRMEHVLLPVRGLRRGGTPGENAAVVAALLRSMAALAERFHRLRPELVVVTGGYAGAPAGLMAALTGVPLALQEQNAVPGVTTRLLSRFADQIHVAFPEAALGLGDRARQRVEFAGNPIRPPEERDPDADRRTFGLEPRRPVVLVVGGSQGSRALNEAFVALARARAADPPAWQLLWSTGSDHLADVRVALAEVGSPGWIRALGYIDDM
ncbi:MAG: UDP-N-acetylglucosamine--N-acetylmuramyl-(pentapeptide) pyrophosphoryl-undecaprenol N-acetylglucosamine transferase, partial [Longimicrobiales bacterium]